MAPLSRLENGGPCFDEMPNVPETQCTDSSQKDCFCGREFLKQSDTKVSCFFGLTGPVIKSNCILHQDDDTCTFEQSDDGTCMCGGTLVSKGQKCYDLSEDCSTVTTTLPCKDILADNERIQMDGQGCLADGSEIDANRCLKGDTVEKAYGEIVADHSIKCSGQVITDIRGCFDPRASNHNEFATIPTECKYK